jgi:hypothetical protein
VPEAPIAQGPSAQLVAHSAAWSRRTRRPLLSVVVPVHNTAPYLRMALDSLVASDAMEVEVVIVHDGGTDEALDIACAWVAGTPAAAAVFDQPNQGLSAARMSGLRHATAPTIGFLDSDDIADIEVLLAMARDTLERDCDVVLCRSAVFDGATLRGAPFYDDTLWGEILGRQDFRRCTLAQEPRLLRLEPNANTRVLRRDFIDRVNLSFPIGLLFEDLPAHVEGLARANAVGLRGETGYLYRVNRPGKITEARSATRIDALTTASMAVAAGAAARIPDRAGGNLALAISRLVFWCAQNITNDMRAHYAEAAVGLFRSMPEDWLDAAFREAPVARRDQILLGAFAHGDAALLAAFAARRRPPLAAALRFLAAPGGWPVRRLLLDRARHRLAAARRRLPALSRKVTQG